MNWDVKTLTRIGAWLYSKEEYGYSLLFLHGAHLGIKITYQLKLKWKDFINKDGSIKKVILVNDGRNIERRMGGTCSVTTELIYKKLKPDLDSLVYKKKNGKPIISNTLNRELEKIISDYQKYCSDTLIKHKNKYEHTDVMELKNSNPVFNREFNFNVELNSRIDLLKKERKGKIISSKDLEIAWALEVLREYGYSHKAFVEVSKHIGHKNVQATIDILGNEPVEFELIFDFSEEEELQKLEEELNK